MKNGKKRREWKTKVSDLVRAVSQDPLRWLFLTIETVTVLSIIGLVFYGAFGIALYKGDPQNSKQGQVIAFLNNNWRALLLLTVPLFYRTVRAYVERLDPLGTRGPQVTPEKPERRNPPEGQ